MKRLVGALVVVCGAAASARADTLLQKLASEAEQRLDAAVAARGPKLVAPQPVALRRQLKKIASLDLGAPLVALVAADLDGDRRAELYAVTARDVIAYAIDRKVRELGRVAFPAEPAPLAPRDLVGSAIVDSGAVVASVSTRARGLRVRWHGKTLVGETGEPGFELCPGSERAELVPGRDYFGAAPGREDGAPGEQVYGVRCRGDLVDPQGYPLRVQAVLSIGNRLDVEVERCTAVGDACQRVGRFTHGEVGVAFEIADLDRDGVPELVFAGMGAPGDPDTLRIASLGDDPKHPKLKHAFAAGGIAGIAIGDVDGDGVPDVIVAVRLVGSTHVDLWRLE